MLWPDSAEAQARTNLRQILHKLRRQSPDTDRHLEITPRTLRWRSDEPYWLDVAAYEELVATRAAETAPHLATDGRRGALREAVALYTGDLLEGRYDEWLLGERERLRHVQLDALAELTALEERAGDLPSALKHAQRLLHVDPLREETYRLLMRLHDARGDRARALRVFHECSATLERELGVEPSGATTSAYEALLARTPAPATNAPAASAMTAPDVTRPARRIAGPPLVGRAPERSQLGATWRAAEAGQPRFVLVSGEPGVGKTRLVEDFLAWCARRGAATAQARCYAAEGELAYAPVVAWLRSDALQRRLRRLDLARLSTLARLLPELLVELPDLPPPEAVPESEQRRQLFDAVAAAVLAAGTPVLLVLDDLQDVDLQTGQVLHYLLRAKAEARLP